MELFHVYLARKCPQCATSLLRVAQSESRDMVVCPLCFRAAGYDEVIEEDAALQAGPDFSEYLKTSIRALHERRQAQKTP